MGEVGVCTENGSMNEREYVCVYVNVNDVGLVD